LHAPAGPRSWRHAPAPCPPIGRRRTPHAARLRPRCAPRAALRAGRTACAHTGAASRAPRPRGGWSATTTQRTRRPRSRWATACCRRGCCTTLRTSTPLRATTCCTSGWPQGGSRQAHTPAGAWGKPGPVLACAWLRGVEARPGGRLRRPAAAARARRQSLPAVHCGPVGLLEAAAPRPRASC
jgi:hypothetical protein